MGGSNAGKVAFARSGSGIRAGVFLDWNGTRGHVLCADGRREVWTSDRLVWVSEARIPLHSPAAAREALLAFCERVSELPVDLEALWDLVAGEPAEYSVAELAEFLWPAAGCEHRAALACALANDPMYFRAAAAWDRFSPHSREAVAQARLRREREAQEQAMVARVCEAVREAIRGPHDSGRDERALAMGIEWLKSLAIGGDEERVRARAVQVVESVVGGQVSDPAPQAHEVLVRLGVFEEDEILAIHRHRIATEFPAEVLKEAERIAASPIRDPERPVLRMQPDHPGPVAIDDPWTTDVDDALMVEETPRSTRVHVLIADPESGIPAGSAVEAEGMSRATTLYMPHRKIPMFPGILSEHAFSLVPGQPRPMLDFLCEFDADGRAGSFLIQPVWAELAGRLTYDEVDALLAGGDRNDPRARMLRRLHDLAERLRARRIEAGAILVDREDVCVRVLDGEIRVHRVRSDSPARRLVTEFMVLACTQAGRFAREHGIPVVYRRQSPPEAPPAADLTPGTRAWAYRMVRSLRRAELSVHPEPHFALGVTGYTQVTSPLRRFQDFVVHRQLKGFLKDGRPPLDAAQILAMFGDLESRTEASIQVDREARRYFLLKYLRNFEGSEVPAEVVACQGNRGILELLDTGLEVAVNGAGHLPLGAQVSVRILEVHPRRDRLSVRIV